jgi:DNA-binding MarR family transcriptional regulator
VSRTERLELSKFLPYRLSIASNLVSDVIAQAYQRLFGLTIPQWRVIAVLAEGGSLPQRALVTRTRMDKMTVSRAVRPLVERGLIARSEHAADGRAHLLSLTGAGMTLYEHVVPEARRFEAALLNGFSAQEVADFTAALDRLESRAQALITRSI